MKPYCFVCNPDTGAFSEIFETGCSLFESIEEFVRVVKGENKYKKEGNIYIVEFSFGKRYCSNNKEELEKFRKKLLIDKL